MDYLKELIISINNYHESDQAARDHLRDLVCIISENIELKNDPMVRNLLYIASQKMRVFGYNALNNLVHNPDVSSSQLNNLRDEAIKNEYRSSVRPTNTLDKSQKEVIEFFQSLEIKRMLVSAPTSYGKTFLMREILFLNHERYKNILLIFPTVALLRENATEMELFVKEKELEYRIIKSVDNEIDLALKNIFVFTPERALQLLASFPDIEIDFFFYDEIYKIDEDYCYDETDEKEDSGETNDVTKTFLDISRGKTFRIALYLLSKRVDEYYLAGPNLKQRFFGDGMRQFLSSNHVAVKEIDFEPTMRLSIKAFGSKIEELEPSKFLPPPQTTALCKLDKHVNEKICNVVEYIKDSGYGKTILYCTTPAKANEYATKLSCSQNIIADSNENFDAFLEHIRKTYDIDNSIKEWNFIRVLEKGFGIHHGKLPKYIQVEVLEQFNHGVFDILFCTSTIVEGVNTDARNMVILNPSKGREPLTPFDIKNIKGRAGRYYHSFVGRIFYMHKELIDIENSDELSLNFATYADVTLDGVDLDNAEFQDLVESNQIVKMQRDISTKEYLLPNEVFEKNRLVPKELQEKLLRLFIKDSSEFLKYTILIKNNDLLGNFLKYNYLAKILNTFVMIGLIDEQTMKRYSIIGKTYYNDGFKGILGYEIGCSRNPKVARYKKTIDQAYSSAFKTLKDVIEHKIPKILSLFESIYSYAAQERGYDIGDFSLSKVKRFYETGVYSVLGEHLVEYGYPLDTIRELERNYPDLLRSSVSQAKEFLNKNSRNVNGHLDAFEQKLLKKALDVIT